VGGKWLEPILAMEGLGGAALRVVYLLREPLSRLWSHIRMSADRMAPDRFAQTCEVMVQRLIAGAQDGGLQGIARRGDYAGNLPKLRRIFGARLLVMFTEDLFTKTGYNRVLAHLGLGAQDADLHRRVHEGRALAMPDALRRAAMQFLRPQYEFVAGQFAALPPAWHSAMQELNITTTGRAIAQEVRI
jgi:hypothetical protein